jgi:hypothetical protein
MKRRTELDNTEELKKEIETLKKRLDKLETKRIFQMDYMPNSIWPRNLNTAIDGWDFVNGIILTDRVTGTKYRIVVDSGTFDIEAV